MIETDRSDEEGQGNKQYPLRLGTQEPQGTPSSGAEQPVQPGGPQAEKHGNDLGTEPRQTERQNSDKNATDELQTFERITVRIGLIGAGLAFITAMLFFIQTCEISHQNQILSSQAIDGVEQSVIGERNTAEQLRLLREQVRSATKTADSAKSSAEAAQRQLDFSERPWLTANFEPTSLFFPGDGFLNLKITITNIGHSIARNISIWVELWDDTRTLRSEGERYCYTPKNALNRNFDGGTVLFPMQQFTSYDHPATIGKSQIEKALSFGDFKALHMIELQLITCIDYRSTLDSMHHQTVRYFMIQRLNKNTNSMMGVFEPHGTYSPKDIDLYPKGLGSCRLRST